MGDTRPSVTVRMDGDDHTFGWPAEEVLLDVLVREGFDAPYSCREGHCGACISRVVRGSVRMTNSSALQASDIEEGYILPCQALPTSDDIHVSYDD